MKLYINDKECRSKKDLIEALKEKRSEFYFYIVNDNEDVLFECKIKKDTVYNLICEFEKQLKLALRYEDNEKEREILLSVASFYTMNFKKDEKDYLLTEEVKKTIEPLLTKEDYLEMAYLCALYDYENGDDNKSIDSLEKEYYTIPRNDLIEKYSLKYPNTNLTKEITNTELTLTQVKPLELKIK